MTKFPIQNYRKKYIMSRRYYNITLFNRITGEEHYFQLFEKNDWFPTFEKYLVSKGIECNGHYVYIFRDKPVEITDLEEFVQAIDETVFYDIIHKNHDSQKNEDPLSAFERYSEHFNFSENFVCLNDTNTRVVPYTSIYQAMLNTFNNSYVFQSYSFIKWLKEHNAIIDENVTWTEHRYNSEMGQKENMTILGKLNPNYKLELTYY